MELHIGVDVGGTFTDLALSIADEGRLLLHKVPSTPEAPHRAIVDGVAQLLSAHRLGPADVAMLSHGTTVGTNALIQRRCGRVAVVTTEGFRDLLEIGRQTRPKVYNMHLDHPPPLVPRQLRFEVAERLLANGAVHRPLDEDGLRAIAVRLFEQNVDVVVVCFLHSYRYPRHEQRAVEILRECLPGRIQVLRSSAIYPQFREYERFSTAALNAALLTVMNDYLDRLVHDVAALGVTVEPKISQSAGGLMSVQRACDLPIAASLSGPAAGVIGAAQVAAASGIADVITLDIGGTSADVSLLKDGRPSEVDERSLAGFPLRLPALDVIAVGSGGGSIAWIDRDGLLKVGPHSAGARPGPACYGFGGGDATVTDANVVLGRLSRVSLLGGGMPIDATLAEAVIAGLAEKIRLDVTTTALGIVRVACSTIVKAIRSVSVERGHNPAAFTLLAFGGAGPLLATEIARDLDIARILVPADPGVLCAGGLLGSDIVADFVRSLLLPLNGSADQALRDVRAELDAEAAAWCDRESAATTARQLHWSADLRYRRQNFEIAVPLPEALARSPTSAAMLDLFHPAHERAYGYASRNEAVELVNLKVRARIVLPKASTARLAPKAPGAPMGERRAIFEGGVAHATPVFQRATLAPGQSIAGPAIIEQLDATTIVHPGDRCLVDDCGNLLIHLS